MSDRWIVEAAEIASQHAFLPVDRYSPDTGITWTDDFQKAAVCAAWDLLEYSRIDSMGTGTGDAFTDAIRWLAEAAEKYGFRHGSSPHSVPPDSPFDMPYLWESPVVVESWPLGTWPPAQHLRLHYLADMGSGWVCRDCGVGLIDVCRNDDIITDSTGRRIVRPDTTKRLPTRDHEVPQAMAGSHGPENLALVCQSCNSRKGAA